MFPGRVISILSRWRFRATIGRLTRQRWFSGRLIGRGVAVWESRRRIGRLRRGLSFALFEHRYAEHSSERCHAYAGDREKQPQPESNERWMALHRVGHLPYHFTTRRV